MIHLHNTAIIGDYDEFVQAWNLGMDLNETSENGWTPLGLSIIWGHIRCVEWLLDHKVDPNKKNNMGSCPLHLATRNRNIACVRLLLDAGADLSITDRDGRIAKDLTDDIDIIRLIEQYDDDIKEPEE